MDDDSKKYSKQALEDIFEQIDKLLVSRAVPIHARHIQAIIEFGKRENISLPITQTPLGVSNPNITNEAEWIAREMEQWFTATYANLQHYDFILGEVLIAVAGNIFAMKIPTVYGPLRPPTWRADDLDLPDRMRSTVPLNIAGLVNNMTSKLAMKISEDELKLASDRFLDGLEIYSYLDINKRNAPLLNEALNDIKASATYFNNQNNALGPSRWSSLQAVEKLFKYALLRDGVKFKKNHDLKQLAEKLDGFDCDLFSLLNEVQVGAGVRYGEQSTSSEEAFEAHTAALKIMVKIVRKIDYTASYDK